MRDFDVAGPGPWLVPRPTDIVSPVKFVLVPGAGGVAWIWNRVVREIERAGHESIAVDLPADDESQGLASYTDIVLRAMDDDSVLVAASLGGFTAAMVCERKAPRALVLLNAMIPNPGERVGAWGENTGSNKARAEAAKAGGYTTDFDVKTYFFHDMSEDLFREAGPHERAQTERIFQDVCTFTKWPKIPIHVVAGRDDRFFPIEFQKRVARERLGLEVEEIAGGHLAMLSNPAECAARIVAAM